MTSKKNNLHSLVDPSIAATTKYQKVLFGLCWLAYFSTYLTRLNFSAVMPELLINNLLTCQQLANIGSFFFISYGIGQLLNGYLGDKVAPRTMIFVGMFVSAACNVFLFLEHSYVTMMLVWGINGFVQSMVWTPILKLGGLYFKDTARTKFGINLSTTVPLGTLAAYGVSLFCIRWFGWKSVFLVSGFVVFSVSVLFLLGISIVIKRLPLVSLSKDSLGTKSKPASFPVMFKYLLSGGIAVMFIPIAIHGVLKDGVTQWVPTLIAANFDIGTNFSLILTMLLPIVNCSGAYLAKYLNKYIKNELTTSAVFFIVALVALFVMLVVYNSSLALTIICLAIVTNCMFAINVMVITLIPLRFSSLGRTSTVSGLLNSIAYVGCGISNFLTGYILSGGSWLATLTMWLVMAAIAIFLSLLAAKKFKSFSLS